MKRNLDYLLLGAILITILFGIITLYSATYSTGAKTSLLWKRQLIWIGIGSITMLFAILFDYQTLGRYAHIIYGVSLFLLVLVLLVGTTIRHTKGWFVLGPLSFQPSELAKITTILMLATYLQNKRDRLNELTSLIIPLIIAGAPILLIMKQPDLGTATTFLPAFLSMLYVAGARERYLISFIAIGALAFLLPFVRSWTKFKPEAVTPFLKMILKYSENIGYILISFFLLLLIVFILWHLLRIVGITLSLRDLLGGYTIVVIGILFSFVLNVSLKDYQQRRLLVFLSPDVDPLGTGYSVIQSKIAIGSGCLFGRGLFSGTQSRLGFLPECGTDFIFSTISEEWGFIGVLIIFSLFLIIISRGFHIANTSREIFGTLLAVGITTTIAAQVLLNVGMTAGILPVVGIPLPLISYGGSSLVITMTALGVLLNIRLRQFLA
ncbi:TPA: rod shape-determining protein RodA [bacterium]|nr:rod shape-determining protein RodA [bacterium]